MTKSYTRGSSSRSADKMGDTMVDPKSDTSQNKWQGVIREEIPPKDAVPPKELRDARKQAPYKPETSDRRYPKLYDV